MRTASKSYLLCKDVKAIADYMHHEHEHVEPPANYDPVTMKGYTYVVGGERRQKYEVSRPEYMLRYKKEEMAITTVERIWECTASAALGVFTCILTNTHDFEQKDFTTENILAHSPLAHLVSICSRSASARTHASGRSVDANDRAAGGGNPRRLRRGGAAAADGIGRAGQPVRQHLRRPHSAVRRLLGELSRAQSRRRPAARRHTAHEATEREASVQRSRRPGNLQTSSLNFLLFFSLQPYLHIIVALAQI
jgi:hypothetical protein